MKLAPIDISQKVFSRKMLGIDDHEVADFLQMVANQLETLIHERNSMKEALRDRDMTLHEYKDRDQVLQKTIQTASQMSERIRGDAEREAKLIITDAHQKAEAMVRDARESLRKMYDEIAHLRRARLQFESNLKALAQAHISLLDQGEKFMPSAPQMNFTERPATERSATERSATERSATERSSSERSADVSPLASM